MFGGTNKSGDNYDHAEWSYKLMCRIPDQPFANVKKGDVIQIRSQDDDESSGCWFKVLENPRHTEDPSTQGRWTFMTEDHAPIKFQKAG